jgi:glycosyltransferase involved in cell wall biosynthesis
MVSVILCTFKGERFLGEAIDSVLAQSFRDFEFIIIDDNGAVNNSATQAILKRYDDPRIILISNVENIGYSASLNKGIAMAKGSYIAIQEHDDVSLPSRLELQVRYLDSYPEIAFVSSSAIVINDSGHSEGVREEYCDDIDLKWLVLWGQPVLHSIVMFRRSVLDKVGHYSEDPAHLYSPDVEMISRILRRYRGANIAEPLFKWRRHARTMSARYESQQNAQGLSLIKKNIEVIIGSESLPPKLWNGLRVFLLSQPSDRIDLSAADLTSVVRFLKKLEACFHRHYNFSRREISGHRSRLYWDWSRHCLTLSYRPNGSRSPLSRVTALTLSAKLAKDALGARII